MRSITRIFFFLFLLWSTSGLARAQSPNGSFAAVGVPVTRVNLGESSVALAGPWKFHTGDNMAWALEGFDDSDWATMDLTPPRGSADASLGMSGDVPGWTARGYAGYSGYAWYRLKVDVQGAKRRLAIKMPQSADDAYQVFVNGQNIGEFGKFTDHVTFYPSLPQAYPLPRGLENGTITIAIRMWMDSATPFNSPDAGGLHGPPILGYASMMAALVRLDFDDIAHKITGGGYLEVLILIMALVMALALFWLDPLEEGYRWLGLVCLVTLLGDVVVLLINFTPSIGQILSIALQDVILAPIRIGLWVLFWGYWFRVSRIALLHRAVWSLVALLMVGTAMIRPPLYGETVPVRYAAAILPMLLAVKLMLAVLLFIVVFYGFKRQKAEGWLAGAAVLLVVIANYQRELRLIHVKTRFSILDFSISLGTMATILSLLVITVMLLRRFIEAQRLKEQWKLEIQQARHVQQVLIPHQLPKVHGLLIESEYRPAREVGGDFFQIIPGDETGTALIAVGDVTGKGVQAGMLVALIVGAIRTAVQHTEDPSEILTAINEQLCDREHASATCLIMRIDADANVTLANAGQLPPYVNDKEIEMEGALPLGIISGAEFSVTSFRLGEGDSLVLMSDGVIEAQDSQGTLFGFERVNEMLRHEMTAKEIAVAAQAFGQEDDILVLRVQRESAHVAPQAEPQFAV